MEYWTAFDTEQLTPVETQVLVIGSGAAGLTTALDCARAGKQVLVVVRDTLEDCNTAKAQGGIAAVMGEGDSTALHLEDTLIAGAGLTDEAMAKILVEEGPASVRDLIQDGALFDRTADGTLALGREGCHSRNRIVHANGDSTGAEVARALRAAAAKEPHITVLEHCYVADLLVKEGTCYGAIALYQGGPLYLRAAATVLATGGLGRLFAYTTNPHGALGAGAALAYRAGAELMDMEFVQFHPTALAKLGCPSFLVSEAVRGAGGKLYNTQGERFMPKHHPMAELAPRDVVARAIAWEMKKCQSDHVLLDTTGIDHFADKFPMITRTLRSYGVDPVKEQIPIAPAAHYMMGGVRTDAQGRTNIARLYACGEAACTGVQGANRLASNSLLEGLVFGHRTAEALEGESGVDCTARHWASHLVPVTQSESELQQLQETLRQLLSRQLGIARDREGMAEALRQLKAWAALFAGTACTTVTQLDLRCQLLVSQLITQAALAREESRGAHYRTDYPLSRVGWQHHSIEKLQKSQEANL